MRATVELPDVIYRRIEETAHARGVSVDALITALLERELGLEPELKEQIAKAAGQRVDFPPLRSRGTGHRVTLPLIHSEQPGTLDLSDFDFDDLLA